MLCEMQTALSTYKKCTHLCIVIYFYFGELVWVVRFWFVYLIDIKSIPYELFNARI